jgi:hypothetical protein
MAAKIGTGDILFRVGSGSPAKVRLGAAAIQDVPGAATLTSAVNSGGSFTTLAFTAPADNGGSPITAYRAYFDGVLQSTYPQTGIFPASWTVAGNWVGAAVQIAAVNAIGEGPLSNAVTVA